MLGWNISVHRQKNGGAAPATKAKSYLDHGPQVAVWQTSLFGLDWIEELVKDGKAIWIAGGGYPNQYTATAKNIIPTVLKGPPRANAVWACGSHDIIYSWWAGKTVIDQPLAEACRPDEWLLIEAWDES